MTTDVHLTDSLQFCVAYLCHNGAGPILLFVIHLRPFKHGTHSLRLAVLVRPAATTTWLQHPCAGCIFVRTSAPSTGIDGGKYDTQAHALISAVCFTAVLLFDVALAVSRSLHCPARCIRSGSCRYSSGDRRCSSCCSTDVLRTRVIMVLILLLFVWYVYARGSMRVSVHSAIGGTCLRVNHAYVPGVFLSRPAPVATRVSSAHCGCRYYSICLHGCVHDCQYENTPVLLIDCSPRSPHRFLTRQVNLAIACTG